MISRAAQLTIVVEAQNSLLTEPAPRAPQCALTSPPRMGPETSEVSALLAPFDAAHAYLRDSAGTLPSDGGTSSVGTASGCAVLTRRYAERDAGARTGAARRVVCVRRRSARLRDAAQVIALRGMDVRGECVVSRPHQEALTWDADSRAAYRGL